MQKRASSTASPTIGLNVSDEIVQALDAAAAEQLLTRSAFVRRVLVDCVRRSGHLAPEARILNSRPAYDIEACR